MSADTTDNLSRSWVPNRVTTWRRVRRLRRQLRDLEEHYQPLLEDASGDNEQRLLSEWDYESQWAESELARYESANLRKLADRWSVEAPASEQDMRTGEWYIPHAGRLKLRREIRDAKRESIRWWIQVVVTPLIALVSSIVALISLLARLK